MGRAHEQRWRNDVVVVAASAGGIEALRTVLAAAPADFDAAILVVLHMPPTGGQTLPRILQRSGHLPAASARDGEALRPGHIDGLAASAGYGRCVRVQPRRED